MECKGKRVLCLLVRTCRGLEEGHCPWRGRCRWWRAGRNCPRRCWSRHRAARGSRAEGHGPGRLRQQRIDRVEFHVEHPKKEVKSPGRPRGCPTARGRALLAAHHDLGSATAKIGVALEPERVVTEPVGGFLLPNRHLPVAARTSYCHLRSCTKKINGISVVRGITFITIKFH